MSSRIEFTRPVLSTLARRAALASLSLLLSGAVSFSGQAAERDPLAGPALSDIPIEGEAAARPARRPVSIYESDLPPSPRGLRSTTLAEPSRAARTEEERAYLETDTPNRVIEAGQMPRVTPNEQVQAASLELPNPHAAGEKLVLAATISESATTESEFTRVVELCEAAAKQGLDGESMRYASVLASWALNRRGELRDEAGILDDALGDFERSARLDQHRWRAIHNRGVSLARMGRFHDAFADMSKTLQMNPHFAKAYSNRAALFEAADDPQSALEDYRKAIELDVTLAAAHAGRGRVCHALGRLDVALIELNEALRLEPDNGSFQALRGDVLADSGRYEQALDAYGQAIEVAPDMANAYRNGAWLLATCPIDSLRDEENALLGAEQALELSSTDRHLYLDTLAAAFANAGQFDEALATIRQAIASAPPQFRGFYQARQKLYQAGKPYRTQPIQPGQ